MEGKTDLMSLIGLFVSCIETNTRVSADVKIRFNCSTWLSHTREISYLQEAMFYFVYCIDDTNNITKF